MHRARAFSSPALVGQVALVVALLLPALQPATAAADPRDPLLPLLHRMNRYFERHETDGVTLDSRYAVAPTEAIRMSVVSQLLGYCELYRVRPSRAIRADVVRHADFLLGRMDSVASHTPFDGMLAYSLLAAYEATGEPRFLAGGEVVVDELKALPTSQCILNGGLMVGMATAEYWRLTGDAEAGQKTRDILALLPAYQNRDGSFPHWCACSEDIHYTGWMAMELILIQRMMDDPLIEPMLEGMHAFMEGRVDLGGMSRYEEPCPDMPDCTVYYYSRASGCSIDYDTRGWTVEPAYNAVLFDHFHSPKYVPVMQFLVSLEDRGTFSDLWDYWPPPDDPEYIWTIADTSVANMSIIFWSLATILSGREDRAVPGSEWVADDEEREVGRPRAGGPRLAGLSTRAETRRRATVDSLFVSGADPAGYCDGASGRSGGDGDGGRPGRGGHTPGRHPVRADPGPVVSSALRVGPILPNPVREACVVRFAMPTPGSVSLAIYDASGRLVRELVSGALGTGEHEVWWDRRDTAGNVSASGLYFVRLRVGEQVRSTRMLVIR